MIDVYFPGADQVEKLLDVAILPEQFKICLTKISMTLALPAHWIFFGTLHPLTIPFSESLNQPCFYSHVPANTTQQHFNNCRAAVTIHYFQTNTILFNIHGTGFNVPVLDFLFHLQSNTSTVQGSMSLCWTYSYIHFHSTLTHPTAHNTSIYISNGVSLQNSNGHQRAHRSFNFLFGLHQQWSKRVLQLCLIRSSCKLS